MHLGLQSMFYKYTLGFNHWEQNKQITELKHLQTICCKRDSVALQAVIRSDDEEYLLTTSRDPLFWKAGALKIARLELEMDDAAIQTDIKIIGLIDVQDQSYQSDILMDQNYIYVEKKHVQQVWLECIANENTTAGDYHGKVRLYTHTLFEDEVLQEEVDFTMTVTEEVLPEPRDYTFYLDLWQHNSNIARKYQVDLWSDEHFHIIEEYLKSLAELGQKALSVIISEIPWSGQKSYSDPEPSDFFEYSMIHVRRGKDGRINYDFSAMDRYIELGFKHGITDEIEIFGLLNIWQNADQGYGSITEGYPDGIRIRYYDETNRTYCFIRKRNELENYIQVLENHLKAKGWMDKVRVLADEPSDVELFRERLHVLRQIAPSFKYKVAINHIEFIQEDIEGIYDYVPLLTCVNREFERFNELKPDIPGRSLYYVCCHPDIPNTFVSSPAIESRVIPWLAERLGLDGFLRWNYTVWPDRPLEKLTYRPQVWKTGDTNFVYPGALGKPLLSLRYKWMQRGIRDFEYMQILKGSGRQKAVKAALDQVFYFDQPSEFLTEKKAERLYSLNPEDYDDLYQ